MPTPHGPSPAEDRDHPTLADVHAAAARIRGRVRRTPLLRADELDRLAGRPVWLKCENLQRGGSFKLRGATNAVWSLPADAARRGVAAHSSGNHAVALALAAAGRGISATVVVPEGAPAVKLRRVLDAGARVVPCPSTPAGREETLTRVLAETGAVEVHPYDDPRVIAGAGTAALELLAEMHAPPGCVIVPVGGGGLASGTAITLAGLAPATVLWGAEPAAVDDAARSLAEGRRVGHTGTSVADGLLTTLSPRTFAVLARHVDRIVTVTEEAILRAVALAVRDVHLVVEPSAAVALAALGDASADLPPGDVVVILSGGNADPDVVARALTPP